MSSKTKQKLTLVTGKGGVGKSVAAAALALSRGRKGEKVLLVELGERSQLAHWISQEVGYEPRLWRDQVDVARWDGDVCLREYIQHLLKVSAVVNLFFENPVMKSFVRAAPALRELALMGKLTSAVRKWGPPMDYDHVILDCFSTGHFLAMLRAPKGMANLIEFGPMGEQSRKIHKVLTDEKVTNYMLVTLPEELPVSEAIELGDVLKNEFTVEPSVICNKWTETDLTSPAIESQKQVEESASPQFKFLESLQTRIFDQEESFRKLQKHNEKLYCAPMIYEAEANKVIDELANWYGKNEFFA